MKNKKIYNVTLTADVDFKEIYENFANDFGDNVINAEDDDVREFVYEYISDDDILRVLKEEDKDEIVDKVVYLWTEDIKKESSKTDGRIKVLKAMNDYVLNIIGDE